MRHILTRCKAHGAHRVTLAEGKQHGPTLTLTDGRTLPRHPMDQNVPLLTCEGRMLRAGHFIKGTLTAEPCSAKCRSAKRHDCECSCAGANHGKAHDTAPAAPVTVFGTCGCGVRPHSDECPGAFL